METENLKSRHSIFPDDPQQIFHEISHTISLINADFDFDFLEKVYSDTERLFQGKYPGYRACNTKYHNLEHTTSVTLAAARLTHGGYLEGHQFSRKNILLTLVATLFHDVGLVQTEEEVEGTGAKFTIGHEERSIVFMKQYLSLKKISDQDLDNCSQFIRCTILNLSTKEIPFISEETETLGKIVGSADLLAQMADRYYLEKLLLLFKEFEEARLPDLDSELVLLKKTEEFYEFVAQRRLSEELSSVSLFMRPHFLNRWGIDRDLYGESISRNLEYLKSLIVKCEESFTCYLEELRRGGIAKEVGLSLKKVEESGD
ncbi:hypothetical protein ACFL9T_07185 [Thermodesulfobacteriota bacterium]